MSEIARRIMGRIPELDKQQAEAAARQQEIEQAQRDKDHEVDELARRALRMGMEVVKLLRGVPSEPVWERQTVGKKIVPYTYHGRSSYHSGEHPVDIEQYFRTAQAWTVYRIPFSDSDYGSGTSVKAIDDKGRILREWRTSPLMSEFIEASSNQPKISGFVEPRFESPSTALYHLESEDFQMGVASLVSGRGPYRGKSA